MKLYGPDQWSGIPWPDTPDGHYARKYLAPMMEQGTRKFISNVDADVYILSDGHMVLPVSIARPYVQNCYVTSPFEHYTSYARAEISVLKNKAERVFLKCLTGFLRFFLRVTGIDKVVYINNWFLSTNLYPVLTRKQWDNALRTVREHFPGRVILMRSVNEVSNQDLLDWGFARGFKGLIARQIFVTDPAKPHWLKKRDFKADRRLLNHTSYKVLSHHELTEEHTERILELYNLLYIDKYTSLNPRFTSDFIKLAIENKTLNMKAFAKDGRIDAVFGYFSRDRVMTTPLFGYDTEAPAQSGLYRILSSQLLLDSVQNGQVLNQSSGAGKFKKSRGCSKYLEYTLYHTKGAGLRQKLGFHSLRILTNVFLKKQLLRHDF